MIVNVLIDIMMMEFLYVNHAFIIVKHVLIVFLVLAVILLQKGNLILLQIFVIVK